MSATRPVEVIILQVLLAAEFANLLVDVVGAACLQLDDPLAHLKRLILKHLDLFLSIDKVILGLGSFQCHALELFIKQADFLFHACEQLLFVLCIFLQYPREFLDVKAESVPVLYRLYKLVRK